MYYPLSQIQSNLYTNGNEYVYSSTKENYTGYYWKTSKGEFFTGKTPQDIPTEKLTPVFEYPPSLNPEDLDANLNLNQEDIRTADYIDIQKIDVDQIISIPIYSPTIPTQQDYQIGEYRRYFCKKTNEIIYLEINKDTYDKLVSKNSTILYQLYQPFNLPWQLTGDKSQVFITNKNITELTSKQQKLPMLSEYLRNDFTKYYK
jgi:hypothetical protein